MKRPLSLFFVVPLIVFFSGWLEVRDVAAQTVDDQELTEQKSDTVLTDIKIYRAFRKGPVSSLPVVSKGGLYLIGRDVYQPTISWDSVDTYRISETIAGFNTLAPTVMDFEAYRELKKEQQKKLIRDKLIKDGKAQQDEGRGLLDFSIKVPGGESSAFSTIFGNNSVNLRINGSANMAVGAAIQKTDDGTLAPDLRRRVDPTFNQDLQLNIQGTIGDKLTIATDWDTQRQFDFENRLSIVYEGYEDEIIKSIEMGNVSMATGNSLISGGSSLFGIKAVSELGPLKVTTVVSQQRGKSNSQKISGGSEERTISLKPADYEDGKHFFLDFYNRQFFEQAVSNPQVIQQPYQIIDIEVYVHDGNTQSLDLNTVNAVALLDLGVVKYDGVDNYDLPNNEFDKYNGVNYDLESYRSPDSSVTNSTFDVASQDFVDAIFRQLVEGEDYTVNYLLGFISLDINLNSNAALAVAYTYQDNSGNIIQVGEINPQATSRTYLKLLRPGGMTTEDSAWPLTMRNIYSLGVKGITQNGFELNIQDTRNNIAEVNLPGRSQTLLEDLGLDRTNTDGSLGADQQIDFTGVTLDAGNGRIMFPYLEPFGERIEYVLKNFTNADDSVVSALAFTELYSLKQNVARNQASKNNFYQITGTSSGGVSGTFSLGFGLVEGSVRVTSNGVVLTEDTDYEVDYSFGSLTILNDKYLSAGQDIEVEFESNQFALIGQKNFTGIRAEYTISDDIKIGSTYFHLSEQPLSDKIRIGNEPINNTMLGLDAKADFQTPWLTRAIDKIPLLQTKAPSSVNFSGEFAQLRPGVAQTNAVQDAIDSGTLYDDEENGLVFIDDFEGARYSISFVNPTRWSLSAAPAAIPGLDEDLPFFESDSAKTNQFLQNRKERSDMRSQFSWYSIPRNISSISSSDIVPETEIVQITDIYQGRVITTSDINQITPLDVYYDPGKRGQYNYNYNLKGLLENTPERTWGGMTTVIPSGQEDLVTNNIEFLEFWVQSVLPGGDDGTGQELDYDGKIYIDLGTISEDVVPNAYTNTEDGFSTFVNNLIEDDPSGVPRSYVTSNLPLTLGQFSTDKRALEDIGLDGAPNPGTSGAEDRDESVLFEDFIAVMRTSYGENSEEFQAIEADPSNDDYMYYGENKARQLPLNERFYRLLGYHDGNTPESGNSEGQTAITLKPDTEGLMSSASVTRTNAYYQYELDWNPADIENLEVGSSGTYIVDKIDRGNYRTWYLVRIPISNFTRKYGEIDSFQNITHMRMWFSGYKKPFTMRFATFEFVGSQWNKVEGLLDSPATTDGFKVASINIEENSNRVPFPYRQPVGSIRAVNRGAQVQTLQNEQSLVLSVDDLGYQKVQMVKKVFNGGLNLLNYSNMRLFLHGEGFDERGDAELIIRMGNDLENNYYEYRQPVSPSVERTFSCEVGDSDCLDAEAEFIWLYDDNSANLVISALNVLKQRRNAENFEATELFEISGTALTSIVGEGEMVDGAVIAVKGTPSLEKVNEIGLGIRNPYDPNDPNSNGIPSLDAEFWVNELRVSGFDNETGWAANAKSTIKFADFATLTTTLTRRTDGFGGLDDGFTERSLNDELGYTINSTINLHKLVPDRYGWNFPVTLSTQRRTTTPKYLPDQGDIRLTDFVNAVNSDTALTSAEKQDSISTKISSIETVNERFSINFSDISKRNSRSKLAQFTIDNMRLTYVYNTDYARSPQLQFQDKWNYSASFSYNMQLRKVKLITPFGFTRNVPVVKLLSGLRLGYLPSSMSFSSGINRNYSESRRRNLTDPTSLMALQQTHNFTQRNSFSLNYSLTQSIPISFRTENNFDLANAGEMDKNLSGIDSTSFELRPTADVIRGIVKDSLKARRSSYRESYTASWRPNLTRIKSMNWLTYSLSYGGAFQWTNSAQGSNLGASVSNTFNLDNSLKIDTRKIFDKLGFYNNMVDANKQESKERKDLKDTIKREISEGVEDSLRTPRPAPNLFKDARYIGRKLFLATFSMRDISTSYKRTKSSGQPGYRGDSQIFYAFNDPGSDSFSPPLAYRMGFLDRIPTAQLIDNLDASTDAKLPATNNITDKFTAGTRITPLENISIDLDWSADVSNRSTETITVSTQGEYSSVSTESGSFTSSVWAFGEGYSDLFKRQLEAAYQDISLEGGSVISDTLGNSDGRSVLNRNTLAEDFRKAYLGSNVSATGSKGFMAFPRPNWRITWSRFEKYIPFIGKHLSNATLSHSYKGTYKVDWSYNPLIGLQNPQSVGSSFQVADYRQEYEPTSLRAERRFSPLAKVSMNWKSGLRTEFGYNRSSISTLAISSKRATETLSQGMDFSVNYTFQNVKIKLFPKIKNNIDVGLRGSYKNDDELSYKLDTDIGNALVESSSALDDPGEAEITSGRETNNKRLTGSLSVGYKISTTISSSFEYGFSRVESNNIPTRTNHDIRFNVRIAIRSR